MYVSQAIKCVCSILKMYQSNNKTYLIIKIKVGSKLQCIFLHFILESIKLTRIDENCV